MKKLLMITLSMGLVFSALAAVRKPNVVILLSDDLGYGDIGCYGGPVKTPTLDGLARDGMRFTDFYAAAAVCSPSRAGLMTGRSPIRSGVYDWVPPDGPMHLPEAEVTLAELLKDRGYTTCHVGKWHLSRWEMGKALMVGPTPGDQGFEYWFACDNNALPSHLNPVNYMRNGKACGRLKGYACQLVAKEAIDWLTNVRDENEPFYLNVWFNEPHKKLASPPGLVAKYRAKGMKPDEAVYRANIENMDRAVGRILAALEETGVADNALVLFSSDNGPWHKGSAGPLRGKKGELYEGGIRVPGIVRWPGHVKPGSSCSEAVGFVDVLPTVAALTGARLPPGRKLDGMNIAPLLEGMPIRRQEPLFWFFYKSSPACALRSGNYVLCGDPIMRRHSKWHPFDQQDFDYMRQLKLERFELYDLQRDIGQQRNLASSMPEKLSKMKAEMIRVHREILSEGPDWDGLPKGKGFSVRATGGA